MKPRLRQAPPLGRQKQNSKSRSKSRSKSKKKRQFDPVKYLNSVIDLPVVIPQKKKKHKARDISSALTNATPVLSQNVSAAKLKSRSSFSQYRKKESKESSKQDSVMKDLFNMNLIDIITESELIKFTEESPNEKPRQTKDTRQDFIYTKKQKKYQQSIQVPPFSQHFQMDPNYAAGLIQKAWKKYRTLKAVEKYYLIYLNQRKNKIHTRKTHKRDHRYNYPNEIRKLNEVRNTYKNQQTKKKGLKMRQQQPRQKIGNQKYLNRSFAQEMQSHSIEENNELASTLKMKPKIVKDGDRYQDDQFEIQTQKNSVDRDQLIKVKKYQNESVQFLNTRRENNVDENLLNWVKVKRKQKWNEIMESFRQERQRQVIGQIKEERQNQISDISNIEIGSKVMNLFNPIQIHPIGQQPGPPYASQDNFEAHNHKISPLFKKSQEGISKYQDIVPFSSSSVQKSINTIQIGNAKYIQLECQILKRKIDSLEEKKSIQIAKVNALSSIGKIAAKQALKKVSNIQTRFNREIRFIEQTMRQYQKSIELVSKISINFHKETMNKKKSASNNLKKAFSAGNIMLKKIIEQSKIANMQIFSYERIQRFMSQNSSQSQFERQNDGSKQFRIQDQQKNFIEQHFSSCSSKSFESYVKNQPQQNQVSCLEDFQINSQQQSNRIAAIDTATSQTLVRKYTQNLQKQIQKMLINEFISQIYLSQGIFQEFRPHIQNLHDFRKISDYDIYQFLQQIKRFYPPIKEMQRLCNQKINPTAREILTIIRDCEYQLEQYELILSQSIFKQYRQYIQNKCQIDKTNAIQKLQEIDSQIVDERLYAQLLIKKAEKINRIKKYKQFEKDLKLIYNKSVFNCLNQYMIEGKSFGSFMNSRSSIGPGQLTMSIRQYNRPLTINQTQALIRSAEQKIIQTVKHKCIIPNFQNMRELQFFQDQALHQLKLQFNEGQFRWVNYMDEVLQIWQDIGLQIFKELIEEVIDQVQYVFQARNQQEQPQSYLNKGEEDSSSSSSLGHFLQKKIMQAQTQKMPRQKAKINEFILQTGNTEDISGNYLQKNIS